MTEEEEKLLNGDGARGPASSREGGGGVGYECSWCVEDVGSGRPEEFEEGPPLGSVASGKLGKSRCECFLSRFVELG